MFIECFVSLLTLGTGGLHFRNGREGVSLGGLRQLT